MRKEFFKGFTMLTLIVVLAFVSAVASANAQTPNQALRAKIPFDFTVGQKTFKAGEIIVERRSSSGELLSVSSTTDSRQSEMRLTNIIQAPRITETGKLVFHKYGDRYYLSQVWTPGNSIGRQFMKSESERNLEIELARNGSRPAAIVAVMAR